MSSQHVLNAEAREVMGKGASRRLRHQGLVPGIVYGGSSDPQMITVKHNELVHKLEEESFYTSIINLQISDNKQKVVLKDLQRHPAKPFILHLDLMRISKKTAIKMYVPLHFIGEDIAPGIKAGGTASHQMTEIEISCLPADLPEFIDVDVSRLDIGDSVHLSEIKLPEGIDIPSLALGDDYDVSVFSLQASRAAKEDEELLEDEALEEAEPEDSEEE